MSEERTPAKPFRVQVRETRYVNVEAVSMHQAVAQVRRDLDRVGEHRTRIETVEDPDTEEGQEVFSWCEGCRKPRLEDDQGWTVDAEDGTDTCPECVDSMEEAS